MTTPASFPSFARYRPALYILGGAIVFWGLLRLRNRYLAPSARTGLRRRNAIRRRRSHARFGRQIGRQESAPPDHRRAIHNLDIQTESGSSYGTISIETENGMQIVCHLTPTQLQSVEDIQATIQAPYPHAVSMRNLLETSFLDSFLLAEFENPHEISQETGEWQYLVTELVNRGLTRDNVEDAFTRFNQSTNFAEEVLRRRLDQERIFSRGNTSPTVQPQAADDQSLFSWRDGNDDNVPTRESQNLLNLLYRIAEDQARRDSYIHWNVKCNSCGMIPIQGIRYRCSNCLDFDLCEACEALGVHNPTHLFYKVRIPAPFLGNNRQAEPVKYPGKPGMFVHRNIPAEVTKKLMREIGCENTELEALYDQFRCLANVEWPDDPNDIKMAIDRKTFDQCFLRDSLVRSYPRNLIFDRMFALYDTNLDNLIGFEEFTKAISNYSNKNPEQKLKRIFCGYDLDNDGYVERRDFLRMFRAYYNLTKELAKDLVAIYEDDCSENSSRDVILGSQPISAAFGLDDLSPNQSRTGEGKRMNSQGDMDIIDGEGVVREDSNGSGDRDAVIGDAAVRDALPHPRVMRHRPAHTVYGPANIGFGPFRVFVPNDADLTQTSMQYEPFEGIHEPYPPDEFVTSQDITNALGAYVPLDEITDQVDRARISACVLQRMEDEDSERVERLRRQGLEERWARRSFYIDEEDGWFAPAGYIDDDDVLNSEVEVESRAPSPRSRSSSKVRFQDDVTDNENETRSNASSRSIIAERWGGFEVPEAERDVGKEYLYQVTQEGFNELLDAIFKQKEDQIMEIRRTRADRRRWAGEIERFVDSLPAGHSLKQGGTTPIDEDEHYHEESSESAGTKIKAPLRQIVEINSSASDSDGHDASYEVPESDSPEEPLLPLALRPDPTLPQNRPDESDLEPFPAFPVSFHDQEEPDHPDVPTTLPPSHPTLPQHRCDTADEATIDSAPSTHDPHVNDVSNAAANPAPPGATTVFDQTPVYESASASASNSTSASASDSASVSSASGTPHPPSASARSMRSTMRTHNNSLPLRLRFRALEEGGAPIDPSASRSRSHSRSRSPSPSLSSSSSPSSSSSSLASHASSADSPSSGSRLRSGSDSGSRSRPGSSASAGSASSVMPQKLRDPGQRRRRRSSHKTAKPTHLPSPPRPPTHDSGSGSGSESRSRSGSASASASASAPTTPPPSPKLLAHYSRLNQAEREAKARGGSGARLSFAEFAAVMQGSRGQKMGFLSGWLDMINFF